MPTDAYELFDCAMFPEILVEFSHIDSIFSAKSEGRE